MTKKKQRGKEGTVLKYITRNQALKKLQIKLPEFRRLCILKGIHPREPKKKVHGHNATYYHAKDINFLLHEPLLDTGRDVKAFERKVVKAKGRLDPAQAKRLQKKRPSYTLDHLVKERYPTFLSAVRDLDDALTLLHLFATLPADASHKISARRVQNSRRLSLEWKAYVARTHSLRKVFVSVKGIYYQAEVAGQSITWLVPHQLPQTIPADVDFRVMLTFLEFYETLMQFVNYKLYFDLGLSYPPLLDPRLEQAAADLFAIIRGLAVERANNKSKQLKLEAVGVEGEKMEGVEEGKEEREGEEEKRKEAERAEEKEAAVRMAQLQSRLVVMGAKIKASRAGEEEQGGEGQVEEAEGKEEEEEDDNDDEETRKCRRVFKGLVFFLSREVPRESLLFTIRAFGGRAAWDGEGSPLKEDDDAITHQVVDRASQRHRRMEREYTQPQWVFDCANTRLLLPTALYGPGILPPPHLSPFVDHDVEGYTPDYAVALQRLKEAAEKDKNAGEVLLVEVEGAKEAEEEMERRAMAALRNEEKASAVRLKEVEAEEKAYAEELAKELSGVPFSASIRQERDGEEEQQAAGRVENGGGTELEERGGEEEALENEEKATVEEEEVKFAKMMMPRKRQQLFQAMEMGKAKKRANVALLEERKKAATGQRAKKTGKPKASKL